MISGQTGRRVLALALFFCPLLSIAQDYRPGYIVTLQGDTTRGFVRYATAKRSERQCYFKAAKKAAKTSYSPDQIRGYGITGDRRFTVIEHPDKRGEKVFARILAAGNAGLLASHKEFLLQKDSIHVLPPTVKLQIESNGRKMVRTDKPYAGVLNIALADCGIRAGNINYNEKEITSLVDQYNKCKDPQYRSAQRRPTVQASLSVFASYIYSDLFLKYDHANMDHSTFLAYGIGVDFSSPRIYDKVSLSLDLTYADMFYQGLIDGQASGYYLREDVYMSFTALRMAAALRVNLMAAEHTPYFKVGFGNYVVIDDDIHAVAEKEVVTGVVLTEKSTGGYDVKNPKGIYLAVGYQQSISKKVKIFTEARYEHMEGFVGTAIQSFSDLANYNVSFGLRIK